MSTLNWIKFIACLYLGKLLTKMPVGILTQRLQSWWLRLALWHTSLYPLWGDDHDSCGCNYWEVILVKWKVLIETPSHLSMSGHPWLGSEMYHPQNNSVINQIIDVEKTLLLNLTIGNLQSMTQCYRKFQRPFFTWSSKYLHTATIFWYFYRSRMQSLLFVVDQSINRYLDLHFIL